MNLKHIYERISNFSSHGLYSGNYDLILKPPTNQSYNNGPFQGSELISIVRTRTLT